jgi:hypothetical protein
LTPGWMPLNGSWAKARFSFWGRLMKYFANWFRPVYSLNLRVFRHKLIILTLAIKLPNQTTIFLQRHLSFRRLCSLNLDKLFRINLNSHRHSINIINIPDSDRQCLNLLFLILLQKHFQSFAYACINCSPLIILS